MSGGMKKDTQDMATNWKEQGWIIDHYFSYKHVGRILYTGLLFLNKDTAQLKTLQLTW